VQSVFILYYTVGLKSQAERFHSYFGIPLGLGFLFLYKNYKISNMLERV